MSALFHHAKVENKQHKETLHTAYNKRLSSLVSNRQTLIHSLDCPSYRHWPFESCRYNESTIYDGRETDWMCSLVLSQASQVLLRRFRHCHCHVPTMSIPVTVAIAVFTVDTDIPLPFLSLSLPSTAWQEQLPKQDGDVGWYMTWVGCCPKVHPLFFLRLHFVRHSSTWLLGSYGGQHIASTCRFTGAQ
jgi:hypothetical protein